MKAILVTLEVTTRIIVPDDFNTNELRDEDYDTVRQKALPKSQEVLRLDAIGDHLTTVEEDTECPFGSLTKDETES